MALIQRKLNQIEKVDFVNKAMYNSTVYSTYKPSAFINACLYDMNTSTNITKIEDENSTHGYLFSDWGIGIRNHQTPVWTTYKNAIVDVTINDFIGGSPTLVTNGSVNLDWGNKVSTTIQGKAYRSAIGFNDTDLFLYCSDTKMTLETLAKEMIKLGCKYAINLDGGGSCHLQEGSKVIKRSYRKNASWFMIFDKTQTTKVEEAKNKTMKIALDYGHGRETAGKRSPDSTLREYEFNRAVGRQLKEILEQHGLEVIETVSNESDPSLTARCKIANDAKADYLISIHANAYGETWNSANGWEIYIVGKGGNAEKLAKSIEKYSKDLGLKNRGIKVEKTFTMLKDTNMPAVLIEHGFYTNKEECEKLKDANFRRQCAIVDAKGILAHLGIAYKETINAEPIPAKDWKIEQYELALKNGIITDVKWKDRLDSNPTAAEIFAMLNKLK
jgi:N-acetylmuramoyl-L-alanine amidase